MASKEQKQEWVQWLSERPESVKSVAQKIVPWKKYRHRKETDTGNRYAPISYNEQEDGSITVTCKKTNDQMPPLGGYNVFGMNPDDLIE